MKKQKQQREGICPHCRRRTQHFLEWQYRRWDQTGALTAHLEDAFRHPSYYIARCDACNKLLLYKNDPPHDDICDNFEGSEPEADTVLVWPESAVSSEAVPERVRECYDEAVSVRERSLNSFATGLRRSLEAICEDRGITNAPLGKRLQTLAFSNELAPRLIEITDVLRFVGNVGSHNDRSVTQDEAKVIDKCFRLLVAYLYEVPDQIRQLKQTLAVLAERHLNEPGNETPSKSGETGKIH
jgi:hypothetical protein